MRLETDTRLNGFSTEIVEPFVHAGAVIANKIKSLQQVKDKIESYKNAQKNGQMLSFEQLSLVARLDDVHSTLKNLLDMQKQFDYIALDTERDRQQLALEAELKRTHQDIAKIKEILLIQDVLENMRREEVRKDFVTGRNGAVKLSEDALDNLDDFYVEISLVRGTEEEFPAFQDQLQQSAEHLLALVEGKEIEIIGTTYAKLKELITTIHMCGYFDHIIKDSTSDSDEELSRHAGERKMKDADAGEDKVEDDAAREDKIKYDGTEEEKMEDGVVGEDRIEANGAGENGVEEDDDDEYHGTMFARGKVDVQYGSKKQSQDKDFVTTKKVELLSIRRERESTLSSPVRKSMRVKVTSRRLAGFDLDGYNTVTKKMTAGPWEKPVCCSECKAAFPTRYRLKVHMSTHTVKELFT